MLCSLGTYAQTVTSSSTIPKLNVVPASAEAASFAKYGETPVSLYSGVPSIGIPIYTIGLKGIKVPISLSYHAGGIKVDEMSGNVGLGWSLSFGGSVTVNVNGIPDSELNGWLNVPNAFKLPQSTDLQTTWGALDDYEMDPKYDFMKKIAEDRYDTQPDLYYANVNGKSFKYFFDQDGNPFTMPYTNVKVNTGHDIVDENDNLFQFAGVDFTSTNYWYYGNEPTFNVASYNSNSFLPLKITTPFQEQINYTYETYSYSFKNQDSETRYSRYPNQFGCAGTMPNDTRTVSVSYVTASRIKKITATNGVEINFYYDQNRTDQPGSAALTSIVVKNSVTNKIIATYTFTYSYYVALPGSTDPDDYRLKLESVQKAGENAYVFQYDANALPKRLSKSQDHWGFYNAAGNTSLLPIDPGNGFPSGANREPSSSVKNGILNKITYPTGGSTDFLFEPNSATVYYEQDEYQGASAWESTDSTVVVPFTVVEGSKNFMVRYKSPYGGDPETGVICDLCDVRIVSENSTLMYSFVGESAPGGEAIVTLQPGNYYLEIPRVGLTNTGFIELSWLKLVKGYGQKTIGGLRVKQITDNPTVGVSKKTYYVYDRAGQPGVSSGNPGVLPKYDYIHNQEQYDEVSQEYYDCLFYAQSISSLSPIGRMQGGPVAYDEVSVYVEDQHKGYTRHLFSNTGGFSGSWEYPFGGVIANDWVDGLPLETKEFAWNEQQNKYFPVKKTINEYKLSFGNPNLPHEKELIGAKVALYKPAIPQRFPQHGPNPRGPLFKVNYFTLYQSWSYPTGKTEILYDQADTTKTVSTNYKYFYDNPVHIQLTRQLSNKSNGEQTMVSLRYPKDITPLSPYYSNPVVEKRIYVKNGSSLKLTGGELTTYKYQPGTFPEHYYGLELAQPIDSASFPAYTGSSIASAYQKRLSYGYDANYNLVSLVNDQVKKQGFKWGYNGTLVIAATTNALDNEFFYEGFEETGVAGNAHTGNKTSNGAYTVSWTKPNSRDYVISYWYLDGVWKQKTEPYTGISMALSSGTAYDDVSIFPADAQLTSYTHEPLVGITSQTDAKGLTTYFEYDTYGRLLYVKDQDKNIIKSYNYHFKN